MANWYIWSGATGTGTGADWTNAFTTLTAATVKAAGDVFFVAHDHAQTQATSMTANFVGTEASPNRMYCVNRAGSVPPVSADLRTTATVTTTSNTSITFGGAFSEVYGITFLAGSGGTSAGSILLGATNRTMRFVNCSMRIGSTAATAQINVTSSQGSYAVFENTTVRFAATGQRMKVNRFNWRNTPTAIVAGGTVPAFVFLMAGDLVRVEAVDLSGATSGIAEQILGATATLVLKDCKLAASPTIVGAATTPGQGILDVQIVRCDSGDTNYRSERHGYLGDQTTETTIVRTGGATDGTTTIAWKIVTSANSRWEWPFECLPITIWNDNAGIPVTVTVQGVWGGVVVPNTDEIWIDCEYLGTSGVPLGAIATSTKASGLASGAAYSAGSGTWGGSTTKFQMTATMTPQEKGPITIYVRAATASVTFYVDPKPLIS